jgi:hypothetical protein
MHSQVLRIMVILQTNAERRLSKRSLKHPSTYLDGRKSPLLIPIAV